MKYDFDEEIDRFKTNSLKWDVDSNELPMWVADMDFKTHPKVIKALEEIVEKGVFGYSIIPDDFFDAINGWWNRRHHFDFKKEWMIYSNGVVSGISSIIRKLTTPGENVLIQSPVYNIFYNSIINNGRNILSNDLIYENGEYHIDFDDLENKLKNPQTTMMILCNPHNPIGKIWSIDDLKRIGYLCKKHHVLVISDEIHCDICIPGKEYHPFASASRDCLDVAITCVSCSKAFNLAGLQSACVIVKDDNIRHKVWRGINTDEVGEPNIFSMKANIAAFNNGDEWIDALNIYLYNNRQLVSDFIKTYLPHLKLIKQEATYLLWIDISYYSDDSKKFTEFIRLNSGLYLSSGDVYGKNGNHFIRMNIATTSKRVIDGLNRLKKSIELFEK